MKIILFAILTVVSIDCGAQTIQLQYNPDNGGPIYLDITKDTKSVQVTKVARLTAFSFKMQDFPNGAALVFRDEQGFEMTDDGKNNVTSTSPLNKTTIKIYLKNKDDISLFAQVAIFDDQLKPSIDLTAAVENSIDNTDGPCVGCNFEGNEMIYDYAKNKVSWGKSTNKWWGSRPVVGDPFSLKITNVNPFRDSIVVSNETVDYNTDVPDLFNKAFFAVAQAQGFNPLDEQTKMTLLADLFALGEKLDIKIAQLKEVKVCTDLCEQITAFKKAAEDQFTTKYQAKGFDPKTMPLDLFIAEGLKGIKPVFRDSVSNVLTRYRKFITTKNYFYYNIPKVQNTDAYVFTVSVLPKVGGTWKPLVDHQPITAPVVGGWKFDFSTGLFITGLRDEHYNLNPDSSVIQTSYGGDSIVYNRRSQIVRQSEAKPVDFGVSALMHVYPRISSAVNVSVSLGAGLSIGQNPQIRYLGGFSLLLGRSGRFVLTGGWAAGFVDVLRDGYQNLQYTSFSDPSVLTKKEFKTSSFFSLSFNLPLTKSKVDASTAASAATGSSSAPSTTTPTSTPSSSTGSGTPAAGAAKTTKSGS